MVVAYSQWLIKDHGHELHGDARQFLDFIMTGGSRMNHLLAALRDYMQVTESGGGELTAASANESLALALSNLQSAIEQSGAVIACTRLPEVMSVPVLLAQVFQNLISNAIRYTRPGEIPRIAISCAEGGPECVFAIEDHGIGIDAQHHERIFGVFKRLHADSAGTGIGLAICKAAVERWGGRIWVDSRLGAGATFRFTAPYPKGTR